MDVVIIGTNLPGRAWWADGAPVGNVHVGVQVGREPEHLFAGDADKARWEIDVRVVADDDGTLDFRGAAVHGKRGDRFLYLTWGDVDSDGSFEMFRRAKLMLNRIDDDVIDRVVDNDSELVGTVDLTADAGGPRCARVDPPAISWSAA